MPVTKPVAVVGLGAILPDAPDVASFWKNIKTGHYAITDVPENRWDPALYYDPDPTAVDKTYSKIGAWVRNFKFEPLKMGLAIPPRVIEQMDEVQQWAIAAAYQALTDYGYPQRKLDQNRTGVILGNALGGEKHYISTMRIRTPEFMRALSAVPEFRNLPAAVQQALLEGMRDNIRSVIPDITEDTMPGELGNIIAGRVANVFNLKGPNFITDAACASSLAALQAAVEGLNDYQFDAVLTGGSDRMMGVEGFVKFCKIGALSPDGSRPYADGANGFVMGEGTAVFLLKRLEDAERDGDSIYAVVRGIGSSSDGKGKGITAPNPTGQEQALERAWKNAGVNPATVGLIEGHGTSTRVGDVVEVSSLNTIFGEFDLPKGKIALGSVKSNIGHLKSAAGAAGMLKVMLALNEKVLPPSVNFHRPNPNIDFTQVPFAVNTQLRDWEVKKGEIRRAGISSFGFGGTNFHVVVDEYIPGVLIGEPTIYHGADLQSAAAVPEVVKTPEPIIAVASTPEVGLQPYRGLFFLSAESIEELRQKLAFTLEDLKKGQIPPSVIPSQEDLTQTERIAIDYKDEAELVKRAERALGGFSAEGNPWQALMAHGIFRGSGAPGKVAFLFPGQGSQYVNMLKDLCDVEPVVADTFAESDRIMTPILGKPLTSFIYVDGDQDAMAEAEQALRNTEITQPAMLTANVAMLRLMQKYGFSPDMVIGHSLGEYAGLVASGVLTFAEALEVVSARGREMKKVSWDDNGCMAAVSAPIGEVEKIIQSVDGYVVIANINSPLQCVIGGTTQGVDAALEAFKSAGYQGTKIPVSHAFHTRIVEPASGPLREVIERMSVQSPHTTIVANVTGDVYPQKREEIIDILGKQVASPVQFIKGVDTLQRLGARVFVEIGPKRVLNALATDILKGQSGITILATNHPREGAVVSFNKALCGLFAAGVVPQAQSQVQPAKVQAQTETVNVASVDEAEIRRFALALVSEKTGYPEEMLDMDLDLEADLGIDTVKQAELFASIRTHYEIPRREDLRLSDYNTLEKVVGFVKDALAQGLGSPANVETEIPATISQPETINSPIPPEIQPAGYAEVKHDGYSDGRLPLTGSVVISGAGLGLPGKNGSVFNDGNIQSILNGDIRIEPLSQDTRMGMLEKRVTRLIKSEAGAVMQSIDQLDQTVKLAGQRGAFDLAEEFGVPADRVEATDISTQLAIAAGIEALRDAGIPLVMAYRRTSKGTYLPDRWRLPEALADETGVIFGSAFPGLDEMAGEATKFYEYQGIEKQILELENIYKLITPDQVSLRGVLEQRLHELQLEKDRLDYHFDRRLVFRILSMGHSQFAEYIGARGPNTHVNAACATTTHAVAVAEDWIRTGRARRVVVVAGDDITSGPLTEWVGTGLMASGAATIEGDPRLAILPFDRRRNGMIMGMGAAALVVESEDAVRERGMRGICEVLATQIANSAFHGTRLDTQHVGEVMERLVEQAEERYGVRRDQIAGRTVFVSHETYTPARGGSASAEIRALRRVFGSQANQVVIANTKGYTGHTMGVGVEDVVAVKALEFGIVPPIANIQDGFEPDPDLGDLRLSRGGHMDVNFALRLGAGFGSQIAMTLTRKIKGEGQRIYTPRYQEWLAKVSGYNQVELVVEKRTLRVRHDGPPANPPAKSDWHFGQGPTKWADGDTSVPVALPAVQVLNSNGSNGAKVKTEPTPAVIEQKTAAAIDQPEVKSFVLQAVSEKTGYPIEMLDLDLDLEADLGIDTVKQAELFATIRTHFDIPRRDDLRLSDYNTLAKVIGFMEDALAEKSGGKSSTFQVQPETATQAGGPAPEAEYSSDVVKAFVLQAVSDKTGYPVEMLDLDLDLEADLGIDTVKQAELFATIRTHFDIPRRDDLRLSDYNTLSKVIGFMEDALAAKRNVPLPDALPSPVANNEAAAESDEWMAELPSEIQTPLQSSGVTIPRRVPVAVLRAKLELCIPTGVRIDHTSRILVVRDSGKTGDHLARKLRELGAAVLVVSGSDQDEMLKHTQEFASEGKIQGIYFLPALDIEPSLVEISAENWEKEVNRRAQSIFNVLRSVEGEPFVVSATRMGGLFGYGAEKPGAPLGGLVSGFTKALSWERPQALVKVVDFEHPAGAAKIAARLLEETLRDPAVIEVGWKDDLRYRISLDECSVEGSNFQLTPDMVYVISGGSGGITAPIVLDLAREAGGQFYLLSRTPLPDPSDPDLAAIRSDRNGFKVQMAQKLRERGEKATPAAIDQRIASLDRAAATLDMMAAVKDSGAGIEYIVCDVTDRSACQSAVERVLAQSRRVDVFIHAAGVEHSRKMETKPVEEFQQTLSVKVHGFFNLFKAMEKVGQIPGAVVLFSSLAGRFGNTGQTDYSAANDLLCKLALALPGQYPGLKSIALDWGAWAEVGMASRGYIPELMKRAGIDMLPPQLAAPLLRKELIGGLSGGEVLLAGKLGVLGQAKYADGGLDIEKANQAILGNSSEPLIAAKMTGYNLDEGIVLTAELDPNQEPFLRDHALNGIPLLPGVMGIEGLSSASRHIADALASEKGGFRVAGLEDVRFLAPFKFYRNQPRQAIWKARVIHENGSLVAVARLESVLTRYHQDPEVMLHFTARVRLEPVQKQVKPVLANAPHWNGQVTLSASEIYKVYFHGPSFQVLEGVQREGEEVIGKLQSQLPSITTKEQESITSPLLVELCMQTAGVWEIGRTGTLALPRSIAKLKVYPQAINGTPIYAEVRPEESEDGNLRFDARVVDAKGQVYLEIEDYRTTPLPYSIEQDQLVMVQSWLSGSKE